VFGFAWREQKEKAHQHLATVPEYLLGKIPSNSTPQAAVTLPNNFVTVFHAVTTDLGLPLPWPRPSSAPEHAASPILIWGGASSVGQFALQILKYYGYTNLLATASPKHHSLLSSYGAKHCFDYRSPSVASDILAAAGGNVSFVLDCIGSKDGSLAPLAKVASKGTKVAVLLPVIVKDASETEAPEYSMDVEGSAPWTEGVEARGVRTHFYLDVSLLFHYIYIFNFGKEATF
jgi:NADPH:quinone reductase-like Zn-dependent oxidoreductase